MKSAKPSPDRSQDLDRLLAQAADEYADEIRQGLRPSITEFAARYPEISDLLRQVLPALEFIHASSEDDSMHDPDESSPPPHRRRPMGDFLIKREIGRGGMGIVYEAEQLSLGRTVALKVLPYAAIMDERAIIRFKNEAHAAASLEHPNIVPVYAVGNERGVYFYAMSLIRGRPLSEIIRECRQRVMTAGPPGSTSLSVHDMLGQPPGSGTCRANDITTDANGAPDREQPDPETNADIQLAISTHRELFTKEYFKQVANLGVQAAEALHHAHMQGIVHRDIKPGNLLLDQAAKLWVTDFGLARIESDPGVTMTGDLVGTLRYMAPEQALAKRIVVDHRADIYALGATLYELVALRPLWDGADKEQILRQIAFDEPKSLSSMNRCTPAALQTIILKSVSKCPDDRYASARELAEDLRAFVGDLPIAAKPQTVLDRVSRWSRRNRTLVATCAVALVVLAIVLAVSAVLLDQGRRNAETARREQEQAALEAEAALSVLESALRSPHIHEKGRAATVVDLLGQAKKLCRKKMGHVPTMQAKLLHVLGQTYFFIGQYSDATPVFEESLEIQQKARGQSDPSTLAVMSDLAATYSRLERHNEALRLLEPLVQATAERTTIERSRELRSRMTRLASVYITLGRYEDSRSVLVDLAPSAVAARDPDASLVQELLAHCEDKLRGKEASQHHGLSDLEEFTRICVRVNEIRRQGGDASELIELCSRGLELARNLSPDQPHQELGMAASLADALNEAGRSSEAEALMRDVYERLKRDLGVADFLTRHAAYHLACTLRHLSRSNEAIAIQEELLEFCLTTKGQDDWETLQMMGEVAYTNAMLHDYEKAMKTGEEAFSIAQKALGDSHTITTTIGHQLAKTYSLCGQGAKAIGLQEAVVMGHRQELGDSHPKTLTAIANLGSALLSQGEYSRALELYEELLPVAEKTLGRQALTTTTVLYNLATANGGLGRWAAAASVAEECLERRTAVFGENHPRTLSATQLLAASYRHLGRCEESVALAQKTLDVQRQVLGPGHEESLRTSDCLARCLVALDRTDEALTLLESTVMEAPRSGTGREKQRVLYTFAKTLLDAGDASQGEDVVRQAIDVQRQMNEDDIKFFLCTGLLGRILKTLGKLEEAELAMVESSQGIVRLREKASVDDLDEAGQIIQCLVDHYVSNGNDAEAERWRRELADLPSISGVGSDVLSKK